MQKHDTIRAFAVVERVGEGVALLVVTYGFCCQLFSFCVANLIDKKVLDGDIAYFGER